jgi:hypothetical protein
MTTGAPLSTFLGEGPVSGEGNVIAGLRHPEKSYKP